MQPNKKLITIKDSVKQIEKLLQELVVQPRLKAIEWSKITHQTPNIKIGYPGQHLASLITGMVGERTGARGNDLIDGSEVKSCSRIDQLDKCEDCNLPVARLEERCPHCGSNNIKRNDDSKWLFTIRDEDDLKTLLTKVKRVLLVIGYYPKFEDNNFDDIKITAYEIWPEHERNQKFGEIMANYYEKIYLAHKKIDPGKTPAPKNFWPFQYQFYMCNPIEVFSCDIENINKEPTIKRIGCVEPDTDRSSLPSVNMPTEILKVDEAKLILESSRPTTIEKCLNKEMTLNDFAVAVKKGSKKSVIDTLAFVSEELRSCLPLRDTDKIAVAKKKYERRVS